MPDLSGLKILVTRPQPQAEQLAIALMAEHADVTVLPMVEIHPIIAPSEQTPLIQDLDHFQHILLTSIPAVRYGLNLIDNWWPQRPINIHWHAIGEATANLLADNSIQTELPSHGVDSEALLTSPLLQNINNQRILIIKGKGGRRKLQDTLSDRGADVSTLSVYRRSCPDYSPGYIHQTVTSQGVNVIVATSGEIIDNLINSASLPALTTIPLVVPSQRVAEQASRNGFQQVIVSHGAGTVAIINSLTGLRETICRIPEQLRER